MLRERMEALVTSVVTAPARLALVLWRRGVVGTVGISLAVASLVHRCS